MVIKLIKKILNIKDKPKQVFMPIDEDSLKRDEQLRIQQQKIESQKAQLSKIFADKKAQQEKEKEKDRESEFNKKLKEQKLDLDAHKHGKIVWFGKFYNDLLIKRPNYFKKHPIEIVDKNDEMVLGKFGDLGIMEGGKFCIKDSEGTLISYGKTLSHVLYKPDAFENMVKRGRFTVPMDKDGNWMEDIEYKEIPEPLDAEFDEETGNIKHIVWSKVKTSEVKKVIARILEEKNMLAQELEYKENVLIKIKSEMDDIKLSLGNYETRADLSSTQLSKSLMLFKETEKRMGDLQTQITKLTELKATYENIMDKKDMIIDGILRKMETMTDPRDVVLRKQLLDELETYKAILPERVEIKQEPPKEPTPMALPGDVVKRN